MAPRTEFDGNTAPGVYNGAQSQVDGAQNNLKPSNGPGLNDPALANALGEHNEKTQGEMDKLKGELEGGKEAVKDLTNTDKEGGRKLAGLGGPDALRDALRGNQGGGGPQGGAPSGGGGQSAPPPASSGGGGQSAPPPPPSQPQMAMPGGPKTTLTPDQLARLLNGAGVSPAELAAAKSDTGSNNFSDTGGDGKKKDPKAIDTKDVQYKKLHTGPLSKSQMHAVIDKALDNNGVTRDPAVRAKWHTMLMFMSEHESSHNPDAVNLSDPNAIGPRQVDGAPAKSSRGLWQTIPPTFAAFHLNGTSMNIYDPVANGSSAISYMLRHYHVDPNGGASFDRFFNGRKAAGYTGY